MVASWWGEEDDRPTCHARAQAKPSRIDGVLANMYVVHLIKKIAVENDTNIPTHSVVKVHISRRAAQEPRTILRTLSSLKKLYQQKVDKMTENMEGKPKQEKQGEAQQKLHAPMDKELRNLHAACHLQGRR